jgi:dolichyl-phosphate beta-glucosyltransferase
MKRASISVVIPAYNEELRISKTIEKISLYLGGRFDYEIIVVDDGSKDKTALVVEGLRSVRLIRNRQNIGKGYSVRRGILEAKHRLILMSDADLSTPIEEIEKLLPFIEEGFDIAIGSRGLKESDIEVRQPWYREGMGKIFNLFVRSLVIGGIKDTQCGFKLMKGDAAKKIFERCRINGFGFDVEALFIARKMNLMIKEVPIRWINSPNSRVRLVGDPIRMFFDLLRIRANWFMGRYKGAS